MTNLYEQSSNIAKTTHFYKYELLEKWLDENIHSRADNLYIKLLQAELITWENIENLFPEIIPEDYSDYEEFEDAYAFSTAKEIYEWYLISEKAYEKFKYWGYPVLQFEEIYLWGRTSSGQSIVVDFYYSPEKIDEIIP